MALPVRLHARQLERAIAQTAKIECKRVYLPVRAPWLETFEAEIATPDVQLLRPGRFHGAVPLPFDPVGCGRAPGAAVLTAAPHSLAGAPGAVRRHTASLATIAKRWPSAGNSSHAGLIASMRRARPPPIALATPVAPPWWSDPKRPPRRCQGNAGFAHEAKRRLPSGDLRRKSVPSAQATSPPHYAGGRVIKSVFVGSASATVSGKSKLVANTSGGFEASHALRSWEGIVTFAKNSGFWTGPLPTWVL
jgi:hypothetical protein